MTDKISGAPEQRPGVFAHSNVVSVTFSEGVSINSNRMVGMFGGCHNLVTVNNIPNSVTSMEGAFYECTNLTQPPNIPNSVTDMFGTFEYCPNLTQAPVIPNSVTSMFCTFCGCTNLIGNIVIKSENISDFTDCFYNTNASKAKNVYIPYKYANGVNTATYNAAFNTSYGINGKNGVTVYNINTYTGTIA